MDYWADADTYGRDEPQGAGQTYDHGTYYEGGNRNSKKKRKKRKRLPELDLGGITSDSDKPSIPPRTSRAPRSHQASASPTQSSGTEYSQTPLTQHNPDYNGQSQPTKPPRRDRQRDQPPQTADPSRYQQPQTADPTRYQQPQTADTSRYQHPQVPDTRRYQPPPDYERDEFGQKVRYNRGYPQTHRDRYDSQQEAAPDPYETLRDGNSSNFRPSQSPEVMNVSDSNFYRHGAPYAASPTPQDNSSYWDNLPSGLSRTNGQDTDQPSSSIMDKSYNIPITDTRDPHQRTSQYTDDYPPATGDLFTSDALTNDPLVEAFHAGELGPQGDVEAVTKPVYEPKQTAKKPYSLQDSTPTAEKYLEQKPRRRKTTQKEDGRFAAYINAQCAGNSLIIINIIFFLFAVAVIGVAVWVILYHTADWVMWDNRALICGCLLVILGSCGVLFISILGGLAGYLPNKTFTVAYISSLVVLSVVLMTGALLALCYRTDLDSGIRKYMKHTLEDSYGVDQDDWYMRQVTYGWDGSQEKLGCCGVDDLGWSDYRHSRWFRDYPGFTVSRKPYVPLSCCVWDKKTGYLDKERCQHAMDGPPGRPLLLPSNNTALYHKGCYRVVHDTMVYYSGVICGLAMTAAFVLIIGIVAGVILYRHL